MKTPQAPEWIRKSTTDQLLHALRRPPVPETEEERAALETCNATIRAELACRGVKP